MAFAKAQEFWQLWDQLSEDQRDEVAQVLIDEVLHTKGAGELYAMMVEVYGEQEVAERLAANPEKRDQLLKLLKERKGLQ